MTGIIQISKYLNEKGNLHFCLKFDDSLWRILHYITVCVVGLGLSSTNNFALLKFVT